MKKYLLYVDIACIINDNDMQMEKNEVRKNQIISGIKKLFEYDFKKHMCDILITDNTCTELYPELQKLLPENTIYRLFLDNRYGSIYKGAGLLQKWIYNKEILQEYEWIIHFEGRQLLKSFSFLDRFFVSPQYYFVYGSKTPGDYSHYYTGLFSTKTVDILYFCELCPKESLIKHNLSIEYPITNFFRKKAMVIDSLDIVWFCSRRIPIDY